MLIVCYIVIGSGINSYLAQIDKKKKSLLKPTWTTSVPKRTHVQVKLIPTTKIFFFQNPLATSTPINTSQKKKVHKTMGNKVQWKFTQKIEIQNDPNDN